MEKYEAIKLNLEDLTRTEEARIAYEEEKPYWNLQRQMIEARCKARLTQKEVAKIMNVKPSTISRLENADKKNATLQTIINYAKAIGLERITIEIPR